MKRKNHEARLISRRDIAEAIEVAIHARLNRINQMSNISASEIRSNRTSLYFAVTRVFLD